MTERPLRSCVMRKPQNILQRERRRHEMAISAVLESIERGECDAETGTEALFTLSDWYEVTGMSIQRAIPKWMWNTKEK